MSTIDRTKYDEDIAERMIGGARLDRTSRPNAREPQATADDRSKHDRRSHERRQNR
jgi:hypothetical protein